jgi:hypothetical protein
MAELGTADQRHRDPCKRPEGLVITPRKFRRSMIARRACRAMVDHAVTVGSDRGNRGIIMALADDTRPWCRLKHMRR